MAHVEMADTAPSGPIEVTAVTDRGEWDREVLAAGGHPLQLWGWGEVKSRSGHWEPHRVRVTRGADRSPIGYAQILVRKLPWPLKGFNFVPRGPAVIDPADRSAVLRAVTSWSARTLKGVGISFEPQWPEGTEYDLPRAVIAENSIFLSRTLIIDLTRSEDELLADLSRTTRQGVRRSARTDLVYRLVSGEDEIARCLAVYRETAQRAEFGLHRDDYYFDVARELGPNSVIYAAFDGDDPVAFLWLAASDKTSFELYAGANDVGRKLRANYSLKWTAITGMKARGLAEYDVNGLLNDGISDFKRSFAKHEDQLVGTIDVPFSVLYRVWTKTLPAATRTIRSLRSGVGRVAGAARGAVSGRGGRGASTNEPTSADQGEAATE